MYRTFLWLNGLCAVGNGFFAVRDADLISGGVALLCAFGAWGAYLGVKDGRP